MGIKAENHAALGAPPGQILGKSAGIARFIGAGISPADDGTARVRQCRLNGQAFARAFDFAIQAQLAHQRRSRNRRRKISFLGVVMQDAAGELVVMNASLRAQFLQARAAIQTQPHQILQIAARASGQAFLQKTQPPAPLSPVGLQTK